MLRKITVCEKIGDNLAQDMVACTVTDNFIKGELIIQMQLSKSQKPVIDAQKIGDDHTPINITICVEYTENHVRFMIHQHETNPDIV